MYIQRHLEKQILESNKKYPVILLTGQRQVGKSTMLYHIKEDDRKYVTFDDINARNLAMNDPKLFFETYGYKLLIDEFQRVPSILFNKLPEKYKDHTLTGKFKDFHECHIKPDWLLIYRIDKELNELMLILFRTGTHSDLFK